MGQAVRKLDAEIAQLKAAIAVAEQTGKIHAEETKAAHDKQVAALKLANDILQQQLAQMAESVPAMLRWGKSIQDFSATCVSAAAAFEYWELCSPRCQAQYSIASCCHPSTQNCCLQTKLLNQAEHHRCMPQHLFCCYQMEYALRD